MKAGHWWEKGRWLLLNKSIKLEIPHFVRNDNSFFVG